MSTTTKEKTPLNRCPTTNIRLKVGTAWELAQNLVKIVVFLLASAIHLTAHRDQLRVHAKNPPPLTLRKNTPFPVPVVSSALRFRLLRSRFVFLSEADHQLGRYEYNPSTTVFVPRISMLVAYAASSSRHVSITTDVFMTANSYKANSRSKSSYCASLYNAV
jgi:hypothetical protein